LLKYFSGIKEVISSNDKKEGDIVTTIEPTVQNFLEDELMSITNKYSPQSANGIIINPQTGEIYAMAHLPTFDLNDFQNVSDSSIYSNSLVENSYEFGSVVKPLVMAIGIDTGVLNASTPFNDKGSVVVGDRTIYNFDKRARGQIDLQQVLSQSLNTGMVFTEQKIGKENFKKYMLNYGLGQKSGIDLPNEATGLVSNLMSGRDVENANISFGQGISFSPITLVKALSSLGNGGYLIQPHLVKEVDYTNGAKKEVTFPKENQPQILKPATSEAISKMLVYSVDHVYGSGKYKMANYSIAAKTGTAQIPDPKNGGYYKNRNLHSFVGYFPAYNPQFLVFLSITAPQGVQYAAETLSQPFFDITKFLISYYEVAPDR
jgi:stage V sporulation protein D (sporulation-specific penicillin-binding protein)